jgi:hypothetical protein
MLIGLSAHQAPFEQGGQNRCQAYKFSDYSKKPVDDQDTRDYRDSGGTGWGRLHPPDSP